MNRFERLPEQEQEELKRHIEENSNASIRELSRRISKKGGMNGRSDRTIREILSSAYDTLGIKKYGTIYEYGNNADNPHQALAEECEESGIPLENVKHYWYKGQKFSIFVKNEKDFDLEEMLERVISSIAVREREPVDKVVPKSDKCLNIILTDMHVGLEPDPKGESMFGYKYNAEIFVENLKKVLQSVLKEYKTHGIFDRVFLIDLSDEIDGWDGFTTRGGHKLDQNLDNVGQFETYVKGKTWLIEQIVAAGITSKVVCVSATNSNHSGDFGQIANLAIKMILDRLYGEDTLSIHILTKFLDHYKYGDHTFILTHGKDKSHMKHGLPLVLDHKTINYVTQYINHHGIDTKYIHLLKGDLHQIGYQRTKLFDYRNFLSFAPSSAWVSTNFGVADWGFSVQVVPKHSNEISQSEYIFEFEQTKNVGIFEE